MFDLSSDDYLFKKMQYDSNKILHERKESLKSDIDLISRYCEAIEKCISMPNRADKKIFNNILDSLFNVIKMVSDDLMHLKKIDDLRKESKERQLKLVKEFQSSLGYPNDPVVIKQNTILNQLINIDESDKELEKLSTELQILIDGCKDRYSHFLVDKADSNSPRGANP
ncbi:MAG: hypothetical protein WAW86_10610 [Gammaproteobacteria bacterium]